MAKVKFVIKTIDVYRVEDRGRDPENPHPDMVRYDGAYICEKYPFFLILLNKKRPTYDRWKTFWQKPVYLGMIASVKPGEWFTYRHKGGGSGELVKEFLSERKDLGRLCEIVFKAGAFEGIEDLLQNQKEERG